MPQKPITTLREWAEAHQGEVLDGLVVFIPPQHRANLPAGMSKMRLCSVWGMGETRGVWVGHPRQAEGRMFPIFNVPVEEFLDWEVIE